MKTLKINIPKEYEIDEEKSTFQNIVFKPINKVREEWIDLGLPSGTLWAQKNSKEIGEYLNFHDAVNHYPKNLPSMEQFEELFTLYHRWNDDKKEIEFLGNNNNILSFPAMGYGDKSSVYNIGSCGEFWAMSEKDADYYWCLYFDSRAWEIRTFSRSCVLTVRLVNNNKLI